MSAPGELDFTGWHPRIRLAYDFWRAAGPPGLLPGRQHIDPLTIPRELLPNLWILDVQREPFRLKYRLVGTRIVEATGREVTGRWLDEEHPHLVADTAFQERYRKVMETGQPSLRRGVPKIWRHRDFQEIENIALPLARDGIQVDMIMVCTVLFKQGHQPVD